MEGQACVHRELITPGRRGSGDEIGTCQNCGQVKRYFWIHTDETHIARASEIVKKGSEEIMATVKQLPSWKPTGRLNTEKRNELYKIGPAAFCIKYGYSPQASGPLFVICRGHLNRLTPDVFNEVTARWRGYDPNIHGGPQATIERPQHTNPVPPLSETPASAKGLDQPVAEQAAAVNLEDSTHEEEELDAFEVATMKVIDDLNHLLKTQEAEIQRLSISDERIKLEIIAHGTALDLYRNRYRQPTANQ